MIFAKIQTNRVSLKRYLTSFQYNRVVGEVLIAPRPEQGKEQRYYFAYLIVKRNSVNYLNANKFKGYKELNKETYSKAVGQVEHPWSAG